MCVHPGSELRFDVGFQRYLTEKTAAVGGELSTMCPWADEMRFHYQWASLLHYANTSNLGNFKFSRQFLLLASSCFQF